MIDAAQQFVCVRLATYESASEAEVMTSLFVGRSGELENTTFGILAPDGKTELVAAHRGPKRVFRGRDSVGQFAAKLREIGARYAKKSKKAKHDELPVVANVRLALNVAACDNRPLVVAFAQDAKALAKIEKQLAPIAWKPEFAGRCNYVTSTDVKDLAKITGRQLTAGVLVVQPDAFGETGTVLVEIAPKTTDADLSTALEKGLSAAKMPKKEHHDHVRAGRRSGKKWDFQIPVTDPGAKRAGERGGRAGRGDRK